MYPTAFLGIRASLGFLGFVGLDYDSATRL